MTYLVKWKGLEYEHCTWETEGHLEDFAKEIDAFNALVPIEEAAAQLAAADKAARRGTGKAGAQALDSGNHTDSVNHTKHQSFSIQRVSRFSGLPLAERRHPMWP